MTETQPEPRRYVGRSILGVTAGFLIGAACVAAWYRMTPQEVVPAAPAPTTPDPVVPAPLESAPPAGRPPPRDARNLADIAAIADDFERNAALYSLAQDTDRTAIENLLAETRELPRSPHRNDIVRLLYVRFASIDPEGAADHVLGWFHQPSWLATVFRVWAHTGFDAAVERAASLEPSQQQAVARSLLEMDLAPWQRQHIADWLNAENLLARVLAREEMAFGTPEQTWARALASPPGEERSELLDMASLAWARLDPEAALQAALDIAEDDDRYLAARVLGDWVRTDRDGALAWLSRLERTPRTEYLPSTVVRTIAEDDIEGALRALEEVPAWARQNAQFGILSQWMETDLPGAMAWFGTLPLADQESHSFIVSREIARLDPEGAVDWAMASDVRVREHLLGSVIASIVDPELAERLFRDIDDPKLKVDVAFWLAGHGPENPQDALAWTETFEGEVRARLRTRILREWAEADPDGPLREVLGQRTPQLRNLAAEDVLSGLLDGFHADAAERVFEAMSSSRARCSAAWRLHYYFAETERDAAKASMYLAISRSCDARG